MSQNEQSKNLFNSLVINLFIFTSILITPFYTFESVNLPKFSVLVILGCIGFIFIMSNHKNILFQLPFLSKLIVLGFLITYFIVFISSDSPIHQQLYGRDNRRNGLITYLCLIIVFILFHTLQFEKYKRKILHRIALSGILVIIYSLLQLLNLDPFKWDASTLFFFSTLGNPNFLSAFIAICAIPILILISVSLNKYSNFIVIVIVLLVSTLFLNLINRTFSYQGFIALFVSIGLCLLIYLFFKRKLFYFYTSAFTFSFFALLALAGTLNKGPLATILYKASVTSRGDFFRSAVNAGNNNLIQGLGFDSFGDNYLYYRDSVAANRSNAEFTDSAHNYFLDIYATQGLFGLIFYLFLTLLTLFCFIKIFKTDGYDIFTLGIFSSWVAIQIQSLVSPTNFLFLIFNFSISGFICGTNLRSNKVLEYKNFSSSIILGFLISLIIIIPPNQRENLILTANQTTSIPDYLTALEKYPKSTIAYARAINLFNENGLNELALQLSNQAIEFNNKTHNAYAIILVSPLTTESEKKIAYDRLMQLDPLNPQLLGFKR
jgi:O-antigen ligase